MGVDSCALTVSKNAVKAAGQPFPQIGFGTWQSKPGEVRESVAQTDA